MSRPTLSSLSLFQRASAPPSSLPTSPKSPSSSFDHAGEAIAVARPSIYRHEPVPRPAPLEQYYGIEPHNIHLISELKSDRLEGFYNLSLFALTFCLLYMFIRNIRETGFLASPEMICTKDIIHNLRRSIPMLTPIPLAMVCSYMLVRLLAKRRIKIFSLRASHAAMLVIFFALAVGVVAWGKLHPLFALGHGMLHVIVVLKLHSYVLTNALLAEEMKKKKENRKKERKEGRKDSKEEQTSSSETVKKLRVYPKNVIWNDFIYFMVAPTLVYEANYPRTDVIRKRYVAMYSTEVFVFLVVEYILLKQFCFPILLQGAMTDRWWWFCIRLALPSFISWLVMFFALFHCGLSVIAELTRFADRGFYKEWWNATTLHQFWRTWNIPVHEWCLRHLYVEAVQVHNVAKEHAAFGTFLMSAILHEYVCAVTFGLLRPYMFCGMMMQLPLIKISNRWRGFRRGNLFMWLMLFVGQSVCAMLYVRDFVRANGGWTCVD